MTTTRRPRGRPTTRPARATAALVTVALLTSAACGAAPSTPNGSGTQGAAESGGGAAHQHRAAAVPPGLPGAQTDAAATAVDLRNELERLLGAHVLLADEMARARTAGRQDLVTALAGSVERNRQDLAQAVTSLAGDEAGRSFTEAWQEHVDVLADYAAALADGDTSAQQSLRARYTGVEQGLGAVLGSLVGPSVPTEAVTAAAVEHGEHLLDQADAFTGGAYDEAYSVQRAAFSHMIAVADVLARGVATVKGMPTTELDAPRRRLQTALSRLLAEHMGVMVQAMRAAQDRSPDFPAAGAAVNANSSELGAAVSTLYGEQASRQFLDIWARHVESLVDYAGVQDQPGREATRASSGDYAPDLARFLAGATEQRLPAIDLAAALTQHDDHLRQQLDAYAEDRLDEAQAEAEQGYAHMFELSQALATAVGDVVASRLPQGGAATGGGGHADQH